MTGAAFSRADIQDAYAALGHEWGWSFMAGPEVSLRQATVWIVGLNPARAAQDKPSDYGCHWDVPKGNIYFDKEWGGGKDFMPLQHQLHAWHGALGIGSEDTLGANFVPFRSRSWATLANQVESVAFARDLWLWVLSVSPAKLILTMGKDPARHLARLMGAVRVERLPAGWGQQLIDVYDSPDGRRIIAMPHPSRFLLFGRGAASDLAESNLRLAAMPFMTQLR